MVTMGVGPAWVGSGVAGGGVPRQREAGQSVAGLLLR